jgi:hypothetical protein
MSVSSVIGRKYGRQGRVALALALAPVSCISITLPIAERILLGVIALFALGWLVAQALALERP